MGLHRGRLFGNTIPMGTGYSREAVALLACLIRTARKKKLTAQELADRAGISRGMLQRIEKGDMKREIRSCRDRGA
jgi:DNA-binding XRE family transcriptional regulator